MEICQRPVFVSRLAKANLFFSRRGAYQIATAGTLGQLFHQIARHLSERTTGIGDLPLNRHDSDGFGFRGRIIRCLSGRQLLLLFAQLLLKFLHAFEQYLHRNTLIAAFFSDLLSP